MEDPRPKRTKQSTWRLWLLMAVWGASFAILAVVDYRPESLGWAGDPIVLVLVVSVLSLLVIATIFVASRLQVKLKVDTSPSGDLPESTENFLDALNHLLGFGDRGPTANLERGRSCVTLAHKVEPFWACVALQDRSVCALELFTNFDGERTLVTSSTRSSGLPAPDGYEVQFLDGVSPNDLLEAHRDAVTLLRTRGWRPKTVVAGGLGFALTKHYDRVLAAFLRRPLFATVTMLWRGISMRDPLRTPLVNR